MTLDQQQRFCGPWGGGRFRDAWIRCRTWGAAVGCIFGLISFAAGWWSSSYEASARLIRNQNPTFGSAAGGDSFQRREPAPKTLFELMSSPTLLRQAASATNCTVTEAELSSAQFIAGDNLEWIVVKARNKDRSKAVSIANLLAGEAALLTRRLQAEEVREVNRLLKEKIESVNKDLGAISQELVRFQSVSGLVDFDQLTADYIRQRSSLEKKTIELKTLRDTLDIQVRNLQREMAQQDPALVSTRAELDRAMLRYTEAHPKVKELRAALAAIEARLASQTNASSSLAAGTNSLAGGLFLQLLDQQKQRVSLDKQIEENESSKIRLQAEINSLPLKQLEFTRIKARHQFLLKQQELLSGRQQEAQFAEDNAIGYYRVFELAGDKNMGLMQRLRPAAATGALGAIAGFLLAAGAALAMQMADGRIRSAADLRRASGLPVLASLGDIHRMTPAERERWAFKTLILLKAHLKQTPRQALVCGFISSNPGEGRSTWIRLLADTARKQGHRVLTISSRHGADAARPLFDSGAPLGEMELSRSLASSLETMPAMAEAGQPAAIEIPLPGWIWNLQRREQWETALQKWREVESLLVLIELPPASAEESIMLARDIPCLIWLCGKNMAKTDETRSQLETLRQCRGSLDGAVLNRDDSPNQRPRWNFFGLLTWLCTLMVACSLAAQDAAPAAASPVPLPATAAASLSVSSRQPLADWQKRLTLGPGDVINIGLYDQPETIRQGIAIGPDGRLNYLQLENFVAAGLSIDEIRIKLEEALGAFYRSPKVIVTPAAYNSKKYYMLGAVSAKGVFPLDQPLSILEAVARARGFETTYQQRNSLMLVDLSRSFLVRQSPDGTFSKEPVDFEALFLQGDLAQNKPVAPDDYFYFPPLDPQEVYVLGEVAMPGPLAFTPDLTVLRAILGRGGYTEKAWRQKVLVVRGSLSKPDTFIVNVKDVMKAQSSDRLLKPGDIIYVNLRPWSKVEDLLDSAIQDFSRSAIITWTGKNIGPIIKKPVFE